MALKKIIDWEQRRYELAKSVLPTILELENQNGSKMKHANDALIEEEGFSWEEVVASRTLDFVDELLRQLKHTNPRLNKNDEDYYNR